MIEESARVVDVCGDRILVQASVKSTCSGCQVQQSCGTGAVARAFNQHTQTLEIYSPMAVKIGDEVIIGIHEKSVLIASWWLYILPLVVFIASNFMLAKGILATFHELIAFAIALVPTLACFIWVSGHIKRLDKGRFQPILLRRL